MRSVFLKKLYREQLNNFQANACEVSNEMVLTNTHKK